MQPKILSQFGESTKVQKESRTEPILESYFGGKRVSVTANTQQLNVECGRITFWSLDGDLSFLLSQTRHGDKISPWLSGPLPSGLHESVPPEEQQQIMLVSLLKLKL